MDRRVWAAWHARMSARSRLTNLGVTMLVVALVVSLLINVRGRRAEPMHVMERQVESCPKVDFHVRDAWTKYPGAATQPLTHLIVVAGHAIWSTCAGR